VVMGVVVSQGWMVVLFEAVVIRHSRAPTHIDFVPSTFDFAPGTAG